MRSKRSFEKDLFDRLFGWIVNSFVSRRINPFVLTYLGLGLAIASSTIYSFSSGYWSLMAIAGVTLLLSGLFDALDGAVARGLNASTKMGSFTDSVLDRVAEVAVMLGIWASGTVDGTLVLLVLSSSLLVSYVRAKAESLGISMEGVGVAERGERLMVIALGSLLHALSEHIMTIVFMLILTLNVVTVVQRCHRVVKYLKDTPGSR